MPLPKDDGKRTEYDSGAVRSDRTGRGRYDLISPYGLKRLAIQYEYGGIQKGDRNWEQGFPISRAICSAIGHLMDQLAGDRSEDHFAAATWQTFAAMHFEELIKLGRMDPKLNDLPVQPVPIEEMAICEAVPGPGSLIPTAETELWKEATAHATSLAMLQDVVGKWAEQQYNQIPNKAICIHLRREVEELAENFDPVEAADCFLILIHFAYKNNINLLEEARKKQQINLQREWPAEPDEEGVYRHIEKETKSK
ncbi:hypothetical protein LCGC14_0612920 [marine sediment metagenome]|uniref:dATP/dGTP diphosphohydrolase MazZ domain-containing protein n=1 Tax=marine sediment metagenome TaxID=412755 RepID=A0A0F9R769_9ZZZZ